MTLRHDAKARPAPAEVRLAHEEPLARAHVYRRAELLARQLLEILELEAPPAVQRQARDLLLEVSSLRDEAETSQ